MTTEAKYATLHIVELHAFFITCFALRRDWHIMRESLWRCCHDNQLALRAFRAWVSLFDKTTFGNTRMMMSARIEARLI